MDEIMQLSKESFKAWSKGNSLTEGSESVWLNCIGLYLKTLKKKKVSCEAASAWVSICPHMYKSQMSQISTQTLFSWCQVNFIFIYFSATDEEFPVQAARSRAGQRFWQAMRRKRHFFFLHGLYFELVDKLSPCPWNVTKENWLYSWVYWLRRNFCSRAARQSLLSHPLPIWKIFIALDVRRH